MSPIGFRVSGGQNSKPTRSETLPRESSLSCTSQKASGIASVKRRGRGRSGQLRWMLMGGEAPRQRCDNEAGVKRHGVMQKWSHRNVALMDG